MTKPKICLLFNGGTIGMVKNKETGALEPAESALQILDNFPELKEVIDLDFRMVANMDSSNMQPINWTNLAQAIYEIYDDYDGFVVAHGTDTMAYSASALSYALQDLNKPVVFTGSLIPLNEIGSDGRNNLIFACMTAAVDLAEVCVVFSNKILRGNRALKIHESFVAIFHSPNFPELGELGRPIVLNDWRVKRGERELKFNPDFDPNIALLKIYPGYDPEIIEKVIERGVKGIIIEGFGPGHVPFMGRSLIPEIERATQNDIPVIMCSQMEKGAANLNAYEVGFKAKQAGAISAYDMTTEAAITKLMWAAARASGRNGIGEIMQTDLAGEITL